jgi:hypothetical protein
MRDDSPKRGDMAAAINRLAGSSLRGLRAEPRSVKLDELEELTSAVPRFERLCWSTPKAASSINPGLSEIVAIIRTRR